MEILISESVVCNTYSTAHLIGSVYFILLLLLLLQILCVVLICEHLNPKARNEKIPMINITSVRSVHEGNFNDITL